MHEDLISRVLEGTKVSDLIDELTKTTSIPTYPKPMGTVRKTRTKKKDSNEKSIKENGYGSGAPIDTFFLRAKAAGSNKSKGTHGGTPWDKKVRALYGNNVPRGSGKTKESLSEIASPGTTYERHIALSRFDKERLDPNPEWPFKDDPPFSDKSGSVKLRRREATEVLIKSVLDSDKDIDDLLSNLFPVIH